MSHRIAGYRALLLGVLTLCTAPAWAAVGSVAAGSADVAAGARTLFAAPVVHQAMPGQTGSLVRVTLALIVVLAAVFAAAWFSRRMHGVGSSRSAALEVIAQLPLGPRERAVLVRVGAQQVLLGVASGNVRALHVLPPGAALLPQIGETSGMQAAAADVPEAMQRPTFKSMLLKSLGK
ncbi:MAG TPA: flagellar biosynthetic protein FliO [Steroidobacteraceae bacterium]|nr:flagellar biosynthetic protein FliO [Steroidobacteraceae bacterium]